MSLNPRELQLMFQNGQNITSFLRSKGQENSKAAIETAYDLQAGIYTSDMEDPRMVEHKKEYCSEISKTILSLCEPVSILEAGVGEATTFSGVLELLESNVEGYGFDLSWSRAAYAKRWLYKKGCFNSTICVGNLTEIPFADNSIDVVYTSHSIEPNGENEIIILQELFRVTRKFLILLEPGYEFACDEAKRRMEHHGYCKDLAKISKSMGYNILRHELFPYGEFARNILNPTAITIIRKDHSSATMSPYILACPRFKTSLKKIENTMYSPGSLISYPIIHGIPCLRSENGILTSKFEEFMPVC